MNSISIKTQFGWISVFEKKGQIIKVREGKCKTKFISSPLKKFKKGLKDYLRKKNKAIKNCKGGNKKRTAVVFFVTLGKRGGERPFCLPFRGFGVPPN